MQNHDDLPHDPLEAALGGAVERPAADDNLRRAVLAQTTAVIRRRRRLKRCVLAAGLLGCYLAGMGTMDLWRPAASATGQANGQHATGVKPIPHKTPSPLRAKPGAPETTQVAMASISGYESWRHIGDHYLRDNGDISLAVAGYSQALDLATEEERAIAPGQDNWLLMALKDARTKERNHAHCAPN